MKVLAFPSDDGACGYYRILTPYSQLDAHVDFFNGSEVDLDDEAFMSYDIYVIQRPAKDGSEQAIVHLKDAGKKIVVELDDLLFDIPDANSAKKAYGEKDLRALRTWLRAADAVTVSTPELAKVVAPMNKNVHVIYNAVNPDMKIYDEGVELRKQWKSEHKEFTVVWGGSVTHYDSLMLIRDVLNHISTMEGFKVVIITGQEFFHQIGFSENVINISGVQSLEFPKHVAIADVFLAPVVRNKFNDCKSELKCIEAGIYGIPTICSPAAPYIRFQNRGGANAIVSGNDKDLWYHWITKMKERPNFVSVAGKQAAYAVHKWYNLNNENKKRLNLLLTLKP